VSAVRRASAAVGPEGALLAVGAVLLAAAAAYVHPALSLAVMGVMCLAAGIAVSRRPRSR
jgi:hypothetical protein